MIKKIWGIEVSIVQTVPWYNFDCYGWYIGKACISITVILPMSVNWLCFQLLRSGLMHFSVVLKCYWPLNNYRDLAHKTMHGYQITCVHQHPTQMNLKYKRFQQFSPKNFFEFVHIFGSVRPVYVTSQEDMNDSHFLPLDMSSLVRAL